MKLLTKTIAALLCSFPFLASNTAAGQNSQFGDFPTMETKHKPLPESVRSNDYQTVYADTVYETVRGKTVVKDSILDKHRVVTNHFGQNWFVFATGGAHTFRGDYSSTSKFTGTISPDWGVGIGKWFTPGLALKVEFIKSESRGYTGYLTGHYGYGPIQLNDKGEPFRDMKTGWWDISGSVLFNFSRLFLGYEGYNSPRRMNQFMGSFGFGGVHHLGYKSHGSDNEWSGHVEVQYSRFFNRAKRFSLDLKLRGLFYQTNFDLEYGGYDDASNKWDTNVGIDVGFTWYLGKDRPDGWTSRITQVYRHDYTQRDIIVYQQRDIKEAKRDFNVKSISFYVFYPNNYSGRNDSPIIEGATVNAIDYLAGGIFTQKMYSNNDEVSRVLNAGGRTTQLSYEDIPTECASNDFTIDCIQRGYEMSNTIPLSPSMQPTAMNTFQNQAGYYYAPIWDGLHEWHYRIDDATLRQQLISSDNYYERESFGLNAHQGLPTLIQYLVPDKKEGEFLVSFADVYAALNGNTGFIANYTDEETVNKIREIFSEGIVTIIEAHGVATSQDNFTGANSASVGTQRNNALAECRAETVTKWLQSSPAFKDTQSLKYFDLGFTSGINPVSDPSTRGIRAKINRCVKVKIQVIY